MDPCLKNNRKITLVSVENISVETKYKCLFRDTPAFGLYMVLYDYFVKKFEDHKSLGLFWAGGLAGKYVFLRRQLSYSVWPRVV